MSPVRAARPFGNRERNGAERRGPECSGTAISDYHSSLRSCPLDAVDVFDGPDTRAPLIGRYCGQQRNVVLYSTEHHLLVTFTTLKRTADSQNRGFLAKFEFSESFVKLGT